MIRASRAALAALFLVGLAAPAPAQPADAEFGRIYQAGLDAYHLGQHERARALFERARRLEPRLPGPHRQLAAVAFAQGRFADCVESAHKALELKSDSDLSARVRELHEECRRALGRPPLTAALEPDQGALAVTSNAEESVVSIDGLTAGPAPLDPRPTAARAVQIEVRGAGYLPARVRALVLVGAVTDVHVVLERDPRYRPPALAPAERPAGKGWTRLAAGAPGRLRIDGRDVKADRRGWVRLDAGVHEASVEADGYEGWRRRIRVAEGQLLTLSVPLVPREVNRRRRILAWSALGTAAAAAAAGFALSMAEMRTYEDAQDLYDQETQRPANVPLGTTGEIEPVRTRGELDDLRDRGARLRTWAAVSYGVAAAALGTSIYYFIRSRSSERAGLPPPFALTPTAGDGVGLALTREVRW